MIKLFLKRTDMPYVPLKDGLRLQILPSIAYLPTCQKHHFAAFIHETSLMVVWDDDPRNILKRAKDIETQLMEMIWEADEPAPMDEKAASTYVAEVTGEGEGDSGTYSAEEASEKPRKLVLTQSVLCMFVLIILIAAIGSGWRQISQEIAIDSSMLRVAFAAVVPLQMWLALVSVSSSQQ